MDKKIEEIKISQVQNYLLRKNKHLLFEAIVNLIETQYDGQITKHYAAVLDLRETK